MPLYEYQCENCSEKFEVMQKFSDEPLVTHEKCGGKVIRLLSVPALQFKGSGWYVNDYAKGSGAGSQSKQNDGEGKKSKESDKSASSTPAAPAASTPAKSSDTK